MIRRFFLSLVLVMTILTAAPLSAGAFKPFGGACSAGGNTTEAVACNNDKDAIAADGPQALMLKVTNVVAYIAGALAIIMIIAGAIRFITAGSDVSTGSRTDTDVEEARRSIGAALIGLVVIVLAQLIITYVIKRL